jgi:N-acetylmuramoyl-L-alanine amidase
MGTSMAGVLCKQDFGAWGACSPRDTGREFLSIFVPNNLQEALAVRRRVTIPFLVGLILSIASAPFLLSTASVAGLIRPPLEELPPDEEGPLVVPLDGPYIVAVQPGHWKIDELPPEQTRRERSIGAVYAGVRELDINLAVVDELVPLLEAEGWEVIVVPATVPPGLRADVFVSIHADWGADTARSGWKLAPPWRPSHASTSLANALKESFRAEGLREDVGGVTVGMRGYFGFASHRYTHASSPYTPAVLVELGFVTNAADRERMVSRPGFYAGIIHRGIKEHFSRWSRMNVSALVPQSFGSMRVGGEGAVAYALPDSSSARIRELPAGSFVSPVDRSPGWYEIRLRNPWVIGWVREDDLVDLN